jgi:predicted phosphoribosyltransferase
VEGFTDRRHAGRVLADALAPSLRGRDDVVVLALPRGGVPVAAEVASALGAPLDAFVVRKLGVPGHEELAFGAVATGGVRVLNDDVVSSLRLPSDVIDAVTERATRELEDRQRALRGDRPLPPLKDRVAVIVDDGLATGATMRAAVDAVRQFAPARVVVAVPVGPPEACAELANVADEVVCPLQPRAFGAVGLWYADFSPTTDDEARRILDEADASR